MKKKFNIKEYQQSFLAEDRLEALYDEKLFKIFVPRKYGGLELDLTSGVRELIRIASIQGGLGWALNLGAGANWFSGFLSDQGANEIFSPQNAVIAGSGFVSGTFEQQGDQFSINGTWSRCTGAQYANFFSLKAKNEAGDIKTFVIPREQVTIADEKWAITGLRNTSSYAISIQDERIPEQYEFEINTILNSNAYGVHAVPFETFARVCMCASFIGIVKCLSECCVEFSLNEPSLEYINLELQPMINAAEKCCIDWAQRVDALAPSDQVTTTTSDQLKIELTQQNLGLFQAVQQLFLKGGLPLVEEDTLVHWAYRDVLTAVQHQMVKG
ncbi:MAG: hypothetical protein Crog4KO_20800 [Crocinitomicaceae bacterium]